MGEIKSTLDLVMEKTRHLKQTEEEQIEQRAQEIRKKVRGLVQKYHDRLLGRDRFLKELDKLESMEPNPVEPMLREEISGRLALGHDHEALFELLTFVCGIEVEPLRTVFDDFTAHLDAAAAERTRELKENLEKESRISGSAVLPNLEADTVFTENSRSLKQTHTERLDAEKAGLLS